jgi:hypothetical protein
MITKTTALTVRHGATFYHTSLKNSDGTPLRCRVNGRCKVWASRPEDYQLPVKQGLKSCFYITRDNAAEWRTEA